MGGLHLVARMENCDVVLDKSEGSNGHKEITSLESVMTKDSVTPNDKK